MITTTITIMIVIMIMIMIIKEIFEIMYLSTCSREITCLIEFSVSFPSFFFYYSDCIDAGLLDHFKWSKDERQYHNCNSQCS